MLVYTTHQSYIIIVYLILLLYIFPRYSEYYNRNYKTKKLTKLVMMTVFAR